MQSYANFLLLLYTHSSSSKCIEMPSNEIHRGASQPASNTGAEKNRQLPQQQKQEWSLSWSTIHLSNNIILLWVNEETPRNLLLSSSSRLGRRLNPCLMPLLLRAAFSPCSWWNLLRGECEECAISTNTWHEWDQYIAKCCLIRKNSPHPQYWYSYGPCHPTSHWDRMYRIRWSAGGGGGEATLANYYYYWFGQR